MPPAQRSDKMEATKSFLDKEIGDLKGERDSQLTIANQDLHEEVRHLKSENERLRQQFQQQFQICNHDLIPQINSLKKDLYELGCENQNLRRQVRRLNEELQIQALLNGPSGLDLFPQLPTNQASLIGASAAAYVNNYSGFNSTQSYNDPLLDEVHSVARASRKLPHPSSTYDDNMDSKPAADQKSRERSFTKALVQHWKAKDRTLYVKATAILKDCADRNSRGEPGYDSDSVSKQCMRRLRELVGDQYWKKAESQFFSQF
jgi:hypothetical protein